MSPTERVKKISRGGCVLDIAPSRRLPVGHHLQPQLHPLPFRAGVFWMTAGNVLYSVSQWAMLVIITKMSSPETVGQLILALAVTAPIVLFTNFQLRTIQAADALGGHEFGVYFSLRFVTASIAVAAIAVIAFSGHWSASTAWVIFSVGIFKAVESFSDVVYGFFQQRERMDYIARSLAIRGPIAALVLGATFYLTKRLALACIAVAVTWLIVLLMNDRAAAMALMRDSAKTVKRSLWVYWSPFDLFRLARLGIPLGAVATLWTLNSSVPRYFIAHSFGERELGFFGAIAYIHVAGTTLVRALGQTAIPKLSVHFATGNSRAFRRLLAGALVTAGAVGAGGIIVSATSGRAVLNAIYSPQYGNYCGLFAWQMVASCCAYIVSVLECALTSAREFDRQFYMVAGTTTATIAGVYLMLPMYGLRAVPLSMVIGYCFYMILAGQLLRKRLTRSLEAGRVS